MSRTEDVTDSGMEVSGEQLDVDEDELLASSDSDDGNNMADDDEDEDDLEDDEDSKLIKTYLEVLARIEKNKYSYDDYVLLVNTAQWDLFNGNMCESIVFDHLILFQWDQRSGQDPTELWAVCIRLSVGSGDLAEMAANRAHDFNNGNRVPKGQPVVSQSPCRLLLLSDLPNYSNF